MTDWAEVLSAALSTHSSPETDEEHPNKKVRDIENLHASWALGVWRALPAIERAATGIPSDRDATEILVTCMTGLSTRVQTAILTERATEARLENFSCPSCTNARIEILGATYKSIPLLTLVSDVALRTGLDEVKSEHVLRVVAHALSAFPHDRWGDLSFRRIDGGDVVAALAV